MKRTLRLPLSLSPLIIVLIVFFTSHSIYAQQRTSATLTASQRDVEEFLQELLPKLATANGEQSAKVAVLATAEKNAVSGLKRISDEKEKALEQTARAERYAAVMRGRIHKSGGAQSIDTDAYENYERSLQEVAAAKSSANALTVQEQKSKEEIDQLQRERRAAEEKRVLLQTQRETVDRLYRDWKASNSEESFKALTGFLTMLAAEQNEISNVDLATVDQQKNETKGALIYYETELARKHQEKPKSSSCATGCTEKDLPKGWYYMWSVRDNKATSDKDRYVHIKGPTDKVEISEKP